MMGAGMMRDVLTSAWVGELRVDEEVDDFSSYRPGWAVASPSVKAGGGHLEHSFDSVNKYT